MKFYNKLEEISNDIDYFVEENLSHWPSFFYYIGNERIKFLVSVWLDIDSRRWSIESRVDEFSDNPSVYDKVMYDFENTEDVLGLAKLTIIYNEFKYWFMPRIKMSLDVGI